MADINVGQISEALNDKADRDLQNLDTVGGADAVIEYQIPTSENNYTWYRKYASGWIEQGGQTPATESNNYEVTLLKAFIDTNYSVLVTCKSTQSTNNGWNYAHTLTTTSFKITQTGSGAFWEAKGMGAQ